MLKISEVASPDDVQTARTLLREYQAHLGIDLGFQGFEAELAGLPGDFAPPAGRLLLARWGDDAVGCVALHRFAGDRGEMKRLFVRESARGRGIARALVARVIDEARVIGYTEIVLDTLPAMVEALRLYTSFGFRDIPQYRENPIVGARFLGRILENP